MSENKVVIEIPKGSYYKYEVCKDTNKLLLDRPLNQSIPSNYGYIQNTLAEDGDALDVFVITKAPLESLCECIIEPIGVFLCEDNGTPDHKIVAGLKGSQEEFHWGVEFDKIREYLTTYKENFKILYWIGKKEDALEIISEAQVIDIPNKINMLKKN